MRGLLPHEPQPFWEKRRYRPATLGENSVAYHAFLVPRVVTESRSFLLVFDVAPGSVYDQRYPGVTRRRIFLTYLR